VRQAPAYPIRYRPDALLNAAVFHDAMPGSTIKPIMAAAFLSDPADGVRWLTAERADLERSATAPPTAESLRGQLARSNSARFLDRMFCADKNFAGCDRPREIQTMAAAFGWNGGCANPNMDCGRQDLLFGRAIDPPGDGGARALSLDVAYGRLLVEPVGGKPGSPFRLRSALSAESRRSSSVPPATTAAADTDDWEKCRGGLVVDVVAEGWGQGQARASALGVAGMMASLAAAANGQTEVHAPHLVEALRGAGPAATAGLVSADDALRLERRAAEPHCARRGRGDPERPVVQPPRRHRAHARASRCSIADLCADGLACRQDRHAVVSQRRSHAHELAQLCADDPRELSPETVRRDRRDRDSCGPLRPYKWYVAAYTTDPTAALDQGDRRADRAQLARRLGPHHGAGDRGPNPAAEIAMQIAGRHVGVLSGARHDGAPGAGVASAGRAATGRRGPSSGRSTAPFATCLTDIEDTLRRAIVQVGDIASIVILIELSLPALSAASKPAIRSSRRGNNSSSACRPLWLPTPPRARR
jgi:hypothetical protein